MIKILQINKLYYPWLGGIETVVKQFGEGFNQKGYSTKVLVINEKPSAAELTLEQINGVEVYKTRQDLFWGAMPISWSFPEYLRRLTADIYHFHLPNPWAVISALWINLRGNIVVTYHSDIVKQKILNIFFLPLLFCFFKRVKIIMVASPQLAKNSWVLRFFAEKIRVVPLGIPTERYQVDQRVRQTMAATYGTGFILGIGRLVGYKGFRYLLSALRRLPDQRLYLVGSGPLREDLERRIERYKLNQRVQIIGHLDFEKLKALLSLSRIFVLPSISNNEAFGIVQLEAMFYGKPVISTNLPTGVSFVNKHNQSGLVVPKKNPRALLKALQVLIKNKKLYAKIARNNRGYVKKYFSEKRMLKSVTMIYREVLKGSPKARK